MRSYESKNYIAQSRRERLLILLVALYNTGQSRRTFPWQNDRKARSRRFYHTRISDMRILDCLVATSLVLQERPRSADGERDERRMSAGGGIRREIAVLDLLLPCRYDGRQKSGALLDQRRRNLLGLDETRLHETLDGFGVVGTAESKGPEAQLKEYITLTEHDVQSTSTAVMEARLVTRRDGADRGRRSC